MKKNSIYKEMISKILNGNSLGSIMEPDPAIPTNNPYHVESLNLPHILVKEDFFVAITEKSIRLANNRLVSFYYTEQFELFGTIGNYDAKAIEFTGGTKKRYKKFEWIFKENKLVFDFSSKKNDFVALRDAVKNRQDMFVIFLDAEDVWNIHPVVLPQINVDNNKFLLQTAEIIYPYEFRNKNLYFKVEDEVKKYMESHNNTSEFGVVSTGSPYISFYHLYEDGTYLNYYDLIRGNTKKDYKQLKVFVRS